MPCYDSVPPSALRRLISPLPGRVALIGAWLCIIIVHVSQACCSLRSDSRRSRCSALGSSLPASSGSTFELGTETQGYPTAYTAHEAASLYRNISRGVVRFLSPKQSTHERQAPQSSSPTTTTMDGTLEQGAVVKVVGVQSNPLLNGTFVRLLRQLQNGRWETQGYSNPAQEAALRPQNLMIMPPLTRQLFYYLSDEPLAELHLEVSACLCTASCTCHPSSILRLCIASCRRAVAGARQRAAAPLPRHVGAAA
jgi:hypothetical protein